MKFLYFIVDPKLPIYLTTTIIFYKFNAAEYVQKNLTCQSCTVVGVKKNSNL